MDDINGLSLQKKIFEEINGESSAGCSEFNLAQKAAGACAENRRVAVLLLKVTKNFPVHYPCAKGDIGICKKQVARKGERRTPGFGCFFYDKLVLETSGEETLGAPICLETSDGLRLPDIEFVARFLDGTSKRGRLDAKGTGHIQVPSGSTFELEYPDQEDIRNKAMAARLAKALDEGDAQLIAGSLAVPEPVFRAMENIIKQYYTRTGDLIEEIRTKTKGTDFADISDYCLSGNGIPSDGESKPTEMVAYSEPGFSSEEPGVAVA